MPNVVNLPSHSSTSSSVHSNSRLDVSRQNPALDSAHTAGIVHSYSAYPYSASTIPPHPRDDDSSDIPTSNAEGDFSSSQLFVTFAPSDRTRRSRNTLHEPTGSPSHHPPSPRETRTRARRLVDDGWLEQREAVAPRKRTFSSGAATTRPKLDVRAERLTSSENGETSRGPRLRVLSLPRHAHRPPSNSDSSEQQSPLTPNSFNDIPPMPIFSRRGHSRHRQQDSGLTLQSTTSSSLYPRSSSTGESFPSPPSLPSQDIDVRIRTVDALDPEDSPHIHELSEMDTDDVSYRLRLLMKNNYYLPPAHSKPYADIPISVETLKKPLPKPTSPTFLDIFKVGKRSKGSSPDAQKPNRAPASTVPILRTTSDTSTVSGLGSTPPRTAPHGAAGAQQSRQEKKGRVVVVRERMDDIVVVAKQAERDLKTREAERKRGGSEHSQTHRDDGQAHLIDPTDSVDIPPSGAFPFGPQASALNGLGIDSSLGAALLADHLPPSSPWSDDTEEEAWRKALLQEAVGHSLSNSPAVTPARTPTLAPSPFRSLDSPTSPSPLSNSGPSSSNGGAVAQASASTSAPSNVTASARPTPRRKRELGQRIVSRMISEEDLAKAMSTSPLPPTQAPPNVESKRPSTGTKPSSRTLRVSSGSFTVPSRAETPVVPTYPLAPPPRRPPLTPVQSDSYSEYQSDRDVFSVKSSIQQATAASQNGTRSSRLPNLHEEHVGLSGAFGALTPPPASMGSSSTAITPSSQQFGNVSPLPSKNTTVSISSGSHYSEDEDDAFHTPMENTQSSSYDVSRPSLTVSITSSDYSEPSPTASAFRDALDNPSYLDGSARLSAFPSAQSSRVSSMVADSRNFRFSTMSPPPRTSSSLAHTILPPPPSQRRSVYNAPRSGLSMTEEQQEAADILSERSPTPHASEPNTPTGFSRLRPPGPLILGEPGSRNSTIPSSSYPPSPISFFDAVEMQSRDEEEDESDDEEQPDVDQEEDTAVNVIDNHRHSESNCAMMGSSSQSKATGHPLRMLLGNRSSPQLATPSLFKDNSSMKGHDGFDRRVPFTNVPPLPQPSARANFLFGRLGKGRDTTTTSGRMTESVFERMRYKAPGEEKRPRSSSAKAIPRPRTSLGGHSLQSWRDEQSLQDQHSRRLDGMLLEHMERERDILRRITTTYPKP